VEEVAAPRAKSMQWTAERKILLFTQITASGVVSFMTCRGNKRADKSGRGAIKYDRRETWNGANGIITMLKTHDAFKGAVWPDTEEGVLQWVCRELDRNKHLFTAGLEQAEPAEAGTNGTKDEEFTEYQSVRQASHPSPHNLHPHTHHALCLTCLTCAPSLLLSS